MSPVATLERKVSTERMHIDWSRIYAPETEKEVRPQIVKDKMLKRLMGAFKKLRHQHFARDSYNDALELVKGLKCSSAHITNLSIALAELQDDKEFRVNAGLFLSALINSCKEENFTVITKHLVERPDRIGYKSTKSITVHGNIGLGAGEWMHRGNIIIEGDAGALVGLWMRGGSITINGSAGEDVGREMTGGEIHLNGGYSSLSEKIYNGDIYHKGKLIVTDGKEI